jgi:hypothetical protein
VPGLWPPPDDSELRLEPGDTVESIRALYDGILVESREILAEVTELDSLSAIGLNRSSSKNLRDTQAMPI